MDEQNTQNTPQIGGNDFRTDEQRAAVARSVQTVENISSNTFRGGSDDFELPSAPAPTDFAPVINANIEALNRTTQTQEREEENLEDIESQILDLGQFLGTESQRREELRRQGNIQAQEQELQNVVNQLNVLSKEASAIPLQVQYESFARGRTVAGAEPIENQRLRKNAVKSLRLAAIGQTLQGNLALAEQNIQRAIDAEFEPEKNQLTVLREAYSMNKDRLARIDKKRADELGLVLEERERLLEIDQTNKEAVYAVGLLARQYGADNQTVNDILDSRTREEALQKAGGFLQDPTAKAQLESIALNNELTKIQIDSELEKQRLLEMYGGMTPSEFNKYQKEEIARIEAIEEEQDKALAGYNAAKDTFDLIGGLMDHRGMSKAVGVGRLARFTPFTADVRTGSVAEFTGSVANLIDQLTLDKLVEAKDRGATFGALSDTELGIIANAATPINNWKRTRSDGSIYFEVSERVFRAQLQKLKDEYENAMRLQRARSGIVDPEEQATLDLLWQDSEDPLSFMPTTNTPQTI